MFELEGRLAVVTGAGSGIGRAIAETLAAQGARVAIADIDLEAARAAAAAIGTARAESFPVDVADQDSVEALRDAVLGRLGVPDILVNNAGWDRAQPFLQTDRPFWEKVVAINLLGPIAICGAFVPAMVERGAGGRVVNIACDAGRVGSTGETVYAGAKGGVIAFTKSLAREVARTGITVNCVCPGPTDTPLFRQQPERIQEALANAIPFKRIARPAEIAAAVAFFASPEAGYITGQVLSVSGGLTMAG